VASPQSRSPALQIYTNVDRQIALAEEALDLLGDSDPHTEALLRAALLTTGSALSIRLPPALRAASVRRLEAILEQDPSPEVAAWARLGAMSALVSEGRLTEAAELIAGPLRAFEELGLTAGTTFSLAHRANLLCLAGDFAVAVPAAEAALAHAQRFHIRNLENGL